MSFTPDLPSTEDVLAAVLSSSTPPLPPQESLLGDTTVYWWEHSPGSVVISAEGGTCDDRAFAQTLVGVELEGHGYRRASFDIDNWEDSEEPSPMPYPTTPRPTGPHRASPNPTEPQNVESSTRLASWPDVMQKSKRLLQSGQVTLLRNGFNYVVGHVTGDHGDYDCEISRDDPNSRAITSWQCSCPWDQYSWQRTRRWKKLEGRPCSHVLALYWKALSTPMDEDLSPEQAEAMGTGQALPAPPVAEHPPEIERDIQQGEKHQDHLPRSFGPEGDIIQGDQQQLGLPPDATGRPGPAQAPMAPPPQGGPTPPGILPPFPGAGMEQPWAGPGTTPGGGVSPPGAFTVPGAKPQTPANPIQNPSTYSKVAGLDPQVQQVLERYEALNPEVRTCDGGAAVLNDMLYRAGIPADLRCGQYWHPNRESRMKTMGGDLGDNEFLDEHHHWVELGPPGQPTHLIDPNGEARGEPRIQPYTPEVGQRYEPRDNWESKSDREFMSWSPLYDNESENIAALVDAPWMETDPTVQAYRKTSADFNAPEVVKLKNDVMGLAEGPVKGQYGDGEYREVPAGSTGEVLTQDPSTGWVEVILPLADSGPHEPFSVRCFLEPGDIEKTNQTNAFIRRHTKIAMPYDKNRDAGWELGLCGEYAQALKHLHPELRYGFHYSPEEMDDDLDFYDGDELAQQGSGWKHAFVHDDHHAYDVAGRHPLPYQSHPGWQAVHNLDESGMERAGIWDTYFDPAQVEVALDHIAQHGDPTTAEYTASD